MATAGETPKSEPWKPAPPNRAYSIRPLTDLLATLKSVRAHPSLSPWERKFTRDILSRYDDDEFLSDKQRAIVSRIITKTSATLDEDFFG